MSTLSLTFLGAFQADLDGAPLIAFRSTKVRALLAYLVLEAERPHARDALMALLWPDDAPQSAQQSLRQALYTLRRSLGDSDNQPGEPFLLVTRQTVQFNAAADYTLDVQIFLRHLDQGELEQAVTLYQAELLAGLGTDSAPFEEWLLNRREYLHNLVLNALAQLAEDALAGGDAAQARAYAQRQFTFEPWREETHQQLMKALAAAGERSAALAQYETCKRILAQELGVEPAAETTALFESIRTGALSRPVLPKYGGQARDHFRHDLGEMPAVPLFVGRDGELAALRRVLTTQSCRLAVVTGMGGVGKTALAVKLTQGFASPDHPAGHPFERIIWRSLLNAPPLDKILQDWLQILSAGELDELPDRLDRRFQLLFRQLSRQRCLLILDNVESIMESAAGQAGTFRSGYEVYDQLLRRMGESDHRSCLVLTSRELPREVARLERDFAVASPENAPGAGNQQIPIHVLQLAGLSTTAGQEILQVLGLRTFGDNGAQTASTSAAALIARYSGNPLALKLVTETISELYDGDVAEFLAEEGAIFEDIGNVLDQQFARLSPLERSILIWLAVEREPITRQDLAEHLVQLRSRRLFLEAMNSLQRRSLLERTGERFTLQNVVIEYTTELLIDAVCEEINRGDFRLEAIPMLMHQALLVAHAKEHIRESQIRLIVRPISERLIARYGQLGLERRLQQLLAGLRAAAPLAPGYAAGNVLNLLIYINADLCGYDFSHLSVWQAYLCNARLSQVNFANAQLASSVFTETFGAVHAVAQDPTGELLAAATVDGEVRLWQAANGQPVTTLRGHTNVVWTLAFSPDGRRLASGSWDCTVRIWDVLSGALGHVLTGHVASVVAVCFSPDGRWLATSDYGGALILWDVATGQQLRMLDNHDETVWSVAFHPRSTQGREFSEDGSRALLASSSADHTIRLWDLNSGNLLDVLRGHTDQVRCVVFDPTGQVLASCGDDRTLRLWNMADKTEMRVLQGHTDLVRAVAFHPNGQMLVSGSHDRTVRLWNMPTGQALHTLHGHDEAVTSVAFDPAGRTVISSSYDQTVRVWDALTGHALLTLHGYTNGMQSVALSPDGRLIASGSDDHLVRLWDAQSGQVLQTLPGHTQGVRDVAFSPYGRLLASGSLDGTVRIWNTASGATEKVLRGFDSWVTAVAFSPDGQLLLGGGWDRTVRLWDVRTGQELTVFRSHSDAVTSVAFAPSGHLIASAGVDHTVCLWDVHSGQLLHTLQVHTGAVRRVTFGPGAHLATAGSNSELFVWDVNALRTQQRVQLLYQLTGHGYNLRAVAFSRDGKRLASAGEDQQVRLWDVESGEPGHVLYGHERTIYALAFSPDGDRIVSASGDETIRVWDVQTGVCLHTLRAEGPYAGMNLRGVTGITEAQKAVLRALGAVED